MTARRWARSLVARILRAGWTTLQDVHAAGRSLRTRPGPTLLAIAMLSLGIGLNGAVFMLVNAAVFKGYLLVHDNHRIARLSTSRGTILYPDFVEWQARSRQFADVALTRGSFHTVAMPDGQVETVFAAEVTPSMFGLLGVTPLLGRGFTPAEAEPGAPAVVVLGYDVWRSRFNRDRTIVGTAIRLDGAPATVVGVMPQGFSFPSTQRLWTPLIPTAAAIRRETPYAQDAYGRLASGATVDSARVELESIGRRLAQDFPATNARLVPTVRPFDEWFIAADARRWVQALWWAVGCVLLIACVNVANLFVLQAVGRSHEISVRLTLGAGRWRLVRVFVFEGMLMSSLGGLVGLGIAPLTGALLQRVTTDFDVLVLTIDRPVVLYLSAISLAVGLTAGLAAAAHPLRLAEGGLIGASNRTIAGNRRDGRVFAGFVCVQMAVAVALLGGAAVTVRSLVGVLGADLGVNPADVVTASLYLPPERYETQEERTNFFRRLRERLTADPGMDAVAFGAVPPTERTSRVGVEVVGDTRGDRVDYPLAGSMVIGPGYFRALGASILSGRDLHHADDAAHAPVAVVNGRFAEVHWPGRSPLGQRFRLRAESPAAPLGPWHTVVGVASNIVQDDRTRQASEPIAYLAHAQHPQPNMFVFARGGPATALAAALRREIAAMDPALPVPALSPLELRLARGYALERNTTALLGVFASVALVLASTGLYAAVAHGVRRRVREIGTRRALGATNRHILGVVCARGLGATAIGLFAGLGLAVTGNRILETQLVGISATDPTALAAACGLLVAAALVGCWLPARRAMRVDPAVVLKAD